MIAKNDGDLAVNVVANCLLTPDGTNAIRLGPITSITRGEIVDAAVELEIKGKGRRMSMTTLSFDEVLYALDDIHARATFSAGLTAWEELKMAGQSATEAAMDEVLDGVLVQQGLSPRGDFTVPFDVVYSDFDHHPYSTRHVFHYSSRKKSIRIGVADATEGGLISNSPIAASSPRA